MKILFLRSFMIFALLGFTNFARAQKTTSVFVDSLIESYGKIDDSTLIVNLNLEAFYRVIKSDEMGIIIARNSRVLAHSLNDLRGETDAINVIGIDFDIKSEFDSSGYYFNLFLEFSEKLQDSVRIGRALNNLGMYNWNRGNFNKAIDLFYRNLLISERLGRNQGVAIASSNIGLIYMELELYEKALEYSLKAYKLREAVNDSNNLAASCNNIGICYKDLMAYDSAMVFYKRGIDYAEAVGNTRQLSELYSNLGNLYLLNNDADSSYIILNLALEYCETESNRANIYNSLSDVAYELNEPKKALEYAVLGHEINLKTDEGYGNLQSSFLVLANAYYLNNDIENSKENFLKWGFAKDTVYSKENAKAIANFETLYQTEKKEKELHKTQQEKAELDLKISARNNQLILVSGASLFLLLAGGFVFYRVKQKQKSKVAEIRIEEQQRGLTAVIQAQEDERKRIAKDLHDGIVQQLGGLKLGLQKVFTDKETDETKKIIKILDNSANELRELSHKMMPRALSELGLIPALEDMLDNSLGNTEISHQFEHFGIAERFAENIEIAIYRIAQELVNNVIKHSKASKVNVQLFKAGADVILIIEDNGKGMNLAHQKNGIGLMNISSRLDTINGKVNFEPSPESGTLATVKIPVK